MQDPATLLDFTTRKRRMLFISTMFHQYRVGLSLLLILNKELLVLAAITRLLRVLYRLHTLPKHVFQSSSFA